MRGHGDGDGDRGDTTQPGKEARACGAVTEARAR